MEQKPNILKSFILTYDPEMTRSLPQKISDDHQMLAFTSDQHQYTMSRTNVFNAIGGHDDNYNMSVFGISNDEFQKALDDTEHRLEVA